MKPEKKGQHGTLCRKTGTQNPMTTHSVHLGFVLLVASLVFFIPGCRVTFASDGVIRSSAGGQKARTLYLPSATDQSSQGGLAARVTQAVQRELTRYPNVLLTSAEDAAVAVDIRIVSQGFLVSTVSECDLKNDTTKTKKIGSEAFRCDEIAFSTSQSDIASESEILQAVVRMSAIDLSSGAALAQMDIPVSSAAFAVVGSTTLATNLADRTPFHALRYAENRDRARDEIAFNVAQRLVPTLLNLRLQP